jgi:hypothetical protein
MVHLARGPTDERKRTLMMTGRLEMDFRSRRLPLLAANSPADEQDSTYQDPHEGP